MKKIIALLLCILMFIGLSACGSKESNDGSSSDSKENAILGCWETKINYLQIIVHIQFDKDSHTVCTYPADGNGSEECGTGEFDINNPRIFKQSDGTDAGVHYFAEDDTIRFVLPWDGTDADIDDDKAYIAHRISEEDMHKYDINKEIQVHLYGANMYD